KALLCTFATIVATFTSIFATRAARSLLRLCSTPPLWGCSSTLCRAGRKGRPSARSALGIHCRCRIEAVDRAGEQPTRPGEMWLTRATEEGDLVTTFSSRRKRSLGRGSNLGGRDDREVY